MKISKKTTIILHFTQKQNRLTQKCHKYGKGVDRKAFTRYNSGIDQERTWQKGIISL